MANADNTFLGLPDAAIGPVTAAIFVGVISLVGLLITKEQKTSEFRQAWINDLRQEIADFLSRVNALRDIHRMGLDPEKHWEMAGEAYMAANQAVFRIKLRLNPKEAPSKLVFKIVDAIEGNFCLGVSPNAQLLSRLEKALLKVSQRLLKKEWDRVRRGELGFQVAKWVTALGLVIIIAAGLARYMGWL
jgi:hypothetical protein